MGAMETLVLFILTGGRSPGREQQVYTLISKLVKSNLEFRGCCSPGWEPAQGQQGPGQVDPESPVLSKHVPGLVGTFPSPAPIQDLQGLSAGPPLWREMASRSYLSPAAGHGGEGGGTGGGPVTGGGEGQLDPPGSACARPRSRTPWAPRPRPRRALISQLSSRVLLSAGHAHSDAE